MNVNSITDPVDFINTSTASIGVLIQQARDKQMETALIRTMLAILRPLVQNLADSNDHDARALTREFGLLPPAEAASGPVGKDDHNDGHSGEQSDPGPSKNAGGAAKSTRAQRVTHTRRTVQSTTVARGTASNTGFIMFDLDFNDDLTVPHLIRIRERLYTALINSTVEGLRNNNPTQLTYPSAMAMRFCNMFTGMVSRKAVTHVNSIITTYTISSPGSHTSAQYKRIEELLEQERDLPDVIRSALHRFKGIIRHTDMRRSASLEQFRACEDYLHFATQYERLRTMALTDDDNEIRRDMLARMGGTSTGVQMASLFKQYFAKLTCANTERSIDNDLSLGKALGVLVQAYTGGILALLTTADFAL